MKGSVNKLKSILHYFRPLLNSIVFNEQESSVAVKKCGVILDDDILNGDEIFENLSQENKAKIQEIAETYFEEVQNLAKSITVFDKGLPESVEETDLFVKNVRVEYSKSVRETLKMAYEIRDELYNRNTKKDAKLKVTPRCELKGSPLWNTKLLLFSRILTSIALNTVVPLL